MTKPLPMHDTNGTVVSPAPLGAVDVAGILLFATLLLVLSYFRSRHRMFWGDEIMGWLVLKQPTWHGLLYLWRAGIDSSGIWFYVLGRPWIAVFGASEISLREFSAAGIAASAAVIWITARRFYSVLPVAAAISFIYSSTLAMTWQLANGRCYGIYMLSASIVVYMLLRGEEADTTRPSGRFLLATFAAYAFLSGSHILGFLYTGGFIGMQLLLDLHSRRFRPKLYLAAAASFVVVLFSKGNLISTAALGKPSYWTVRPALRGLITMSVVLDERVFLPIFLLLVLVLLALRRRARRVSVYVLALGFAALDVLIFVQSRISTSIYVDRYLLPFSIITILLLCELLVQLREADTYLPRVRALFPVIFLLIAAASFFLPSMQRAWYPIHDYTATLLERMPPGLPIVDTDVASYVEIQFYHHDALANSFYFPVDWETALSPDNKGGVSGFHEMDNFKATGLYANGIVPYTALLDRYKDFAVLTGAEMSPWFRRRILDDPRFESSSYSTFQGEADTFHIYVVHRK